MHRDTIHACSDEDTSQTQDNYIPIDHPPRYPSAYSYKQIIFHVTPPLSQPHISLSFAMSMAITPGSGLSLLVGAAAIVSSVGITSVLAVPSRMILVLTYMILATVLGIFMTVSAPLNDILL